jgi:hypothetical protein
LRALFVIGNPVQRRRKLGLKFRFPVMGELGRLAIANQPHLRIANVDLNGSGPCQQRQHGQQSTAHVATIAGASVSPVHVGAALLS